jgi:type IV pilus assembly protein PilB
MRLADCESEGDLDVDGFVEVVGRLLVERGCVSEAQLEELSGRARQPAAEGEGNIEQLLLESGAVTEGELLAVYGEHLGMPVVDLAAEGVDPDAVLLVPAEFAKRHHVIALRKGEGGLTVAVRNPLDVGTLDELGVLTRLSVRPVIASSEDILRAIETHYGLGAATVERLVRDGRDEAPPPAELEAPEAEGEVPGGSIVNYVDQLLEEAHQKRATDIHVEPFEDRLRVRYRIDGVLCEVKTPKAIKQLQQAIVSRLKVMARLDITERRRPQDGRCLTKLGGEDVDLRLSTFPTLFGEGISIRLLGRESIFRGLDQLGLTGGALEALEGLLAKPNGIVLVTGPTGCGKTTTLYACLSRLNDSRVKIVTLEDPVEYQLDGVDQIQMNPGAELTFANGLRSVLRQDPDIIMVGEIRDLETARIATRAALTGHLMFSTLHTNDALSTITRLLDMGIEPYLVADTVKGVVAQRLVRLVCTSCRGEGCEECSGTGYLGRTGIYEILVLDDETRSLISATAPMSELKRAAAAGGMKTLRDDGMEKVAAGLTTREEVIRVTEQA